MLWHFQPDYHGWKTCPQTYQFVASDHSPKGIAHHIPKYSCFNRTYMVSKYESPGCYFNEFQESIKQIESTLLEHARSSKTALLTWKRKANPDLSTKRIFYIGDSLTVQLFIAARCALETYKMTRIIEPHHIVDPFLRNDLPCNDRCATDKDYFNRSRNEACDGCGDNGERKDYMKDYVNNPSSWMRNIPHNTLALVIGTGTWYNHMKTLMDHEVLFQDTIEKTVLQLARIRKERPKLSIFWLGLPPIITSDLFDKYDWKRFADKDRYAEARMTAIGVHFVNVTRLTMGRKNHDYNACADGLHWW